MLGAAFRTLAIAGVVLLGLVGSANLNADDEVYCDGEDVSTMYFNRIMTKGGGGGFASADAAINDQTERVGIGDAVQRELVDEAPGGVHRVAFEKDGKDFAAIEVDQGPSGEYYVTAFSYCVDSSGIDKFDIKGWPTDEPGNPGLVTGDDSQVEFLG